MRKLALAAGLLCVLAPAGAWAADLDGDDVGPPERRSYSYEDPRYSDMYGEPRRLPPPDYGYRPAPVPPPGPYAYRHEPRFAEPPPRYVEPPRYAGPEE